MSKPPTGPANLPDCQEALRKSADASSTWGGRQSREASDNAWVSLLHAVSDRSVQWR
jgi:hypothetical protein